MERTEAVPAAAKARGKRAGAVERMRAARKAQAGLFAANVLPTIPEVQAAGYTSFNAIAGQLNARRSLATGCQDFGSPFVSNHVLGSRQTPPFLLRPPLQNMRSLPDRYPDLRPVLDGVGKDFLRLAKTIAGIKQAIDSHAVPRPLLDLVEIAIIRAQRLVGLFV